MNNPSDISVWHPVEWLQAQLELRTIEHKIHWTQWVRQDMVAALWQK